MSTIAVFLVLGGGAVAAVKLGKIPWAPSS
jgi:hypothetical protein